MNATFLKQEAVRLTFLLHRWLGAALGLLMLTWCLSGIVMMYVPYPALQETDRVQGLTPIDWSKCCTVDSLLIGDEAMISRMSVEMLGARPVLRVQLGPVKDMIDLQTGRELGEVPAADSQAVAIAYGQAIGAKAPPNLLANVHNDQWSVYGGFDDDRPLSRFALNDSAGTQIYVSAASGKAVQKTTATERFWNWFGAIPHWLYFVELRQNPYVWTQVIVYSSALGCFLAMLGLYIGIRQWLRAGRANRASPYKGFMFWHHVPGLIFGIFTLTFVASGLFSMNPWGLFENGSAREQRDRLTGGPMSGLLVLASLSTLPSAGLPPGIVSVAAAPLGKSLFLVTTDAAGHRVRLDPTGNPQTVRDDEWQFIADATSGHKNTPKPELITAEDTYYFSHHREQVQLPAYRLILGANRYYFDPVSGQLLMMIDAGGEQYRWMHQAMHRLDFSPLMRSRPIWDIVMLILMAGVTFVCATGAYIGVRFLIGRPVRSRKPLL